MIKQNRDAPIQRQDQVKLCPQAHKPSGSHMFACSLTTGTKEFSKYKLDFVGVQEVRWDRDGTKAAGEYTFFYENRKENHELGTGFFLLYIRESYQ
jgi:hypothetical protein